MTKQTLQAFITAYRDHYGKSYPVAWGKHGAVVKRLLNTYSFDEMKVFIAEYFQVRDEFVIKNGHKLELLATTIPKLIQQIASKEDGRRNLEPAQADFERIAAARRAAGNGKV